MLVVTAVSFLVFAPAEERKPPTFTIKEKKSLVVATERPVPWNDFQVELVKRFGQSAQGEQGHIIYTIEGKKWMSIPQVGGRGPFHPIKELVLLEVDEDS